MPVIKSAIKKLRQDKERTAINDITRRKVDVAVSKAKKEQKDFTVIAQAYSEIDKAAKKGLIAKNKAAHMKSALAKRVKPTALSTKPVPHKSSKKAVA